MHEIAGISNTYTGPGGLNPNDLVNYQNALLCQYMASSLVQAVGLVQSSDGHGGAQINDLPANQSPFLSHPHV